MSKEVFQQIEQDVNGDLEYAKEKVKKGRQALQCAIGVLILPLVLLIMLSGGATMVGTCQKNSQDKKRDNSFIISSLESLLIKLSDPSQFVFVFIIR